MAAKRYVMLDKAGKPVNTCVWDSNAAPEWSPPPGITLRLMGDGEVVELPVSAPTGTRPAADKIAAAVAALGDIDQPGKGNNAAELKAIIKQLRDALAAD